jgi:site-specific recombinase XerD
MSPARKRYDTMPERYDQALEYGHEKNLPPEILRPKPTQDWPPENVELLNRYTEWLSGGGASLQVIRNIYIPMAGHILGLALKPHFQLDLDRDLQPGLDYVLAKGVGPDWAKVSRNSMLKFRRFLRHTRGQTECKAKPFDVASHAENLPEWLVAELERWQHIQQRNWRTARLQENIHRFWCGHLRTWRYFCHTQGVRELSDLKRAHITDYAAYRIEIGRAVTTVNGDLRSLHGFLRFLQEEGYLVPQSLLRRHCLKQPDRLPQHLTDEQVRLLQADLEGQVRQASYPYQKRDALLTRALFYLLWQAGMRKGEVEELRLEDLDLAGRRLSVRNGKGLKDRTVYLTETAVHALRAYLAVRGQGPTDHVFLYRNQPLSKDLIHGRLKAAGERIGIHLHAHRLRHTCGTQLLNAGCPVTSIQKFLGHKKLNTTMGYARASDQTVDADYFAAMERIEHRLNLADEPQEERQLVSADERGQILALAERLTEPELSLEARLELVANIRWVLAERQTSQGENCTNENGRGLWEHPSPSPASVGVGIV